MSACSPSGGSHVNRRNFLSDLGMGFSGLALSAMLHRDGYATSPHTQWSPPDGKPHFAPRAKNVIWLFMIGGVSHLESFDPKPALNQYAGLSIDETPHKDVLHSPLVKQNLESGFGLAMRKKLLPLQVSYRQHGQSGIAVSDWFPHIGACVDDLSVIRSMWTTDNNHGAQYQFHTGRNKVQGLFPSVGSWVHYGLGTLNENLPQFVVMGQELGDCCGGIDAHGAAYLGPQHAGVQLSSDSRNPLPYISPDREMLAAAQRNEFKLLGRLNRLGSSDLDNPVLQARIKSYELAFRMQTAVPELVDLTHETSEAMDLYGVGKKPTDAFGQQCLIARRLVERGTRFVQIYHGSNNGAGHWDGHNNLKAGYSRNCPEVDQPIAALLRDLKRRGLLNETLVVFATEFGRTPGVQGQLLGRDHHPYGFSIWMAGGGVRGGVVHGSTDELGFHAVEDRHYVTDVHATVLHQLGLDSHRLEVPGRKRLDIDHGSPIKAILA